VISPEELDWLVAVLDAVLNNPEGYPCVEHDPWKLEYVASTDERCVTCQRLHDRLNCESERMDEITMKRAIKVRRREEARARK